MFARAQFLRQLRVLGPGRGELDVELQSLTAGALERGLRIGQRPFGVDAALGQPLAFDPKIGLLDVETREIVPHPLAGGSGVVDGVAQRRGVADRAEHVAPGGLDIPLEAVDFAGGQGVGVVFRHQGGLGVDLFLFGAAGAVAPRLEFEALRITPRAQRLELLRQLGHPRTEHVDLLPVQLDLLLGTANLELVRVRAFA